MNIRVPDPPPPEGYVDTSEACKQLGIAVYTLREWFQQGKLKGIRRREGMTYRLYLESDSIREFIEKRTS